MLLNNLRVGQCSFFIVSHPVFFHTHTRKQGEKHMEGATGAGEEGPGPRRDAGGRSLGERHAHIKEQPEVIPQHSQAPLASLALNEEVDASDLVSNDHLITDILAAQNEVDGVAGKQGANRAAIAGAQQEQQEQQQQEGDGELLLEREMLRVAEMHTGGQPGSTGGEQAGLVGDATAHDPALSAFLAETQVRSEQERAFLQQELPPDIERAVAEEMYNPMYQLPEDDAAAARSASSGGHAAQMLGNPSAEDLLIGDLPMELLEDDVPLVDLEPITKMDEDVESTASAVESTAESTVSQQQGQEEKPTGAGESRARSRRKNVFSLLSEVSGSAAVNEQPTSRATRLRTGSMQRRHYTATAVLPDTGNTREASSASTTSVANRAQRQREKEDEDMYEPMDEESEESEGSEEESGDEHRGQVESSQVWCLCKTTDDSGFMIGCDGGCDNW